jgi:hypothetical protein
MRALSLTQPWAWSMMHGPKLIENRTWPAEYMVGQRFALHASMKWDHDGERFLLDKGVLVPPKESLPKGAIIGMVSMIRCVDRAELECAFMDLDPEEARANPPWMGKRRCDVIPADQEQFFFGPYGFLLADRAPITPLPYPGSLSFFQLHADAEREISARLGKPVDITTPTIPQQAMPWEPPGGLVRPPRRYNGGVRRRR